MAYLSLGSRDVKLLPDASTLNPGNLTFNLTQDLIAINVQSFELYHLVIPTGLPSGTVVSLYQGRKLFTAAQLDTIGDWDPNQAMILAPGTDVYLCTTIPAPAPTTPVVATCWFRYDAVFAVPS